MMRIVLATLAVMTWASAGAGALELAPSKDELFAYPDLLSQSDGGDYRVVDYVELRDINQRDEVPERRVWRRYISLGVRKAQQDMVLRADAGEVRHFAVGTLTGARFIVLYVHGKGGSRKQGVDDYTFGGNFNRIKNLAVDNGGLYIAPDFSDFGSKGASEVETIIDHYSAQSPGAQVFVACGSMGGAICWELANDTAISKQLGGLLLLGSHWDDRFLTSPAFKAQVPVFFGHGSKDPVFAVATQEAFFRSIRARKAGYPSRFVRFETGTHGTPIRMVDWRETLNWMMSIR